MNSKKKSSYSRETQLFFSNWRFEEGKFEFEGTRDRAEPARQPQMGGKREFYLALEQVRWRIGRKREVYLEVVCQHDELFELGGTRSVSR
jgi:hypothetical protein